MKSGKLVLGILAGVSAGAILGILFAPAKGCDTRKKILNKKDDYADAIKDKYDELVDAIAKKYEAIEKGAEDLVEKGKSKLQEVKHEFS
ncbi:MAG: YtxH domain-containing protein [Bacteroidetes bacterium]|jgi:gas vesicle protein|nr:YtxH domain-containing protein [Bacteroidota bacterium]